MSIYTRADVKEIITTKYLGKQGKLLKIEEGERYPFTEAKLCTK